MITQDSERSYYIETTTTSNANLTAKYYLVINTQKTYEAGDLEVRLPYELFDARTGTKGTVFSSIGIGSETNPTSSYNFTYKIDDHGTNDTSDDELVIYNYKDISGSNNISIPVIYTITPYNVKDISVGTIQATASGSYVLESGAKGGQEEQTSNAIQYRLDTGVTMSSFTKTLQGNDSGRIYYWNSSWGTQPEDFDMTKYNYVSYQLYYNGVYANQPSQMFFTDTPEDGGEVYRVYNSSSPAASTALSFTKNEDGSYSWQTSVRNTANPSYSGYYCVIVRYPRTEVAEGEEQPVYHNEAATKIVAVDNPEYEPEKTDDYNDVVQKTASVNVQWKDYEYVYSGNLYSASKYMSSFPTASITRLEYGLDVSTSFSAYFTVNGYNLKDGYQMDWRDDAFYARASTDNGSTYGEAVRLTEDDYEYIGKPSVYINTYRINRTNGQTIAGQETAHEFKVYGRKGSAGEWELLDTFTLAAGVTTLSKSISKDLTGLGYTAVKVVSDEGLTDYSYGTLSGQIKVKADSPLVKSWFEEYGENLTRIRVDNFAGFRLFYPDESGTYEWMNIPTSEIAFAKQYDLDDADLEDADLVDGDGTSHYVYRATYNAFMSPVSTGSSIQKVAQVKDDGVSDRSITAHYYLNEYEYFDYNGLPTEIYDQKSQDTGVFYDLLPLGYYYDSSKAVSVYGSPTNWSVSASGNGYGGLNNFNLAGLVSVETVDNYRDTGRQMVIIKVESLAEPGKNWKTYNSYYKRTGFAVDFYATASYDDVTPQLTQYNIAAFQRGDDTTIFKGYDENGCGSYSSSYYDNIYVNDPTGTRVLSDPNNDGENKASSTLYAYTSQQAVFSQAIETGIKKLVKANSGKYVKDDTVDVTSDYSYKLSYTSSTGGTSRNVILYDILEDAANTGGFSGEKAWYGTFRGVNIQQAINQGIAVKVWYSTKKNLDYNTWDTIAKAQDGQYLPEYDTDTWTDVMPEDPSTVTAVAFDFRTTTTGEEKKFVAQESVSVEVLMTAPEQVPTDPDVKYAYNRPAYNMAFQGNGQISEEKHYNISERTTLLLRDLQDITFTKVYYDEDEDVEKPLGGTTFKLYQCTNTDADHVHTGMPGNSSSCWGTTVLQTASSRSDGTVEFKDLDTGTYAVVETSSRSGFVTLSNRYWVFEVDASRGTISEPTGYSTSASNYPAVQMKKTTDDDGNTGYTLRNERMVRNISVSKTWYDSGASSRPKEVTFTLYRNDVEYRTIKATPSGSSTSFVTSGNVCTFTNLPIYDAYGNAYTYKVKENVPDGYYTSLTDSTVTAGSASTNNAYTTVSFYNYAYGKLKIRKNVTGETTDRSFQMELTLKQNSEAYVPDGGITARRYASASASEYTEEILEVNDDGVAAFSLQQGEVLELVNLPAVSYSLQEIAEKDDRYTVTYAKETGTVQVGSNAGNIAEAVVTNAVQPTTLTLPVQKIVTGPLPENSSEEFAFTLEKAASSSNAPLPSVTTVSIEGTGTADFAAIRFTEAGTYQYLVKETIPAAASQTKGYTYDETVHTITVNVTSQSGQLVADWTDDQTAEGETAEAITFTNVYQPLPVEINLPVRKLISGNATPEDKTFTFVLTAETENAPMPKTGSGLTVTETAAEMTIAGAGEKNFDITFTKTGIYTYKVKETAGTDQGYTYAADTEYTVEVTITDNAGQLAATWTVNGEKADKLTFTNVYEPTPVSLKLPVQKTIEGHDRTEEKTFTFEISRVTEDAPLPANGQTKITIPGSDSVGTNEFDEIKFTKAGTYQYMISEQDDGELGYTYAGAKSITVVVTDHNGALSAAWTVDDEEEAQTAVSFVNQYQPLKVGVVFPVEKIVEGNERPEGKTETFTFTLTAEDNQTPMPDGKMGGSAELKITDAGTENFGEIDFTSAGIYRYTLAETKGTAAGYGYDTTVRNIVVTIQDDNGQLVVRNLLGEYWEVDDEKADKVTFTNVYDPDDAVVVLPVSKTITGNKRSDDNKKDFTFTLKAEDPNENAPMPANTPEGETSVALTIRDEGESTFDAITFDKAGIYHYTVMESNGGQTGYTYDTTVRNIVVTVTDQGGKLVAKTEITKNGETENSLSFQNNYEPTAVSVTLPVEKTITGNEVPDGEEREFVFTLTADPMSPKAPMPRTAQNNTAAVSVTGEGTASFGRITYTEAGTYRYTLAETDGGEHGYTYDTVERSVIVTVVDKNGTLEATTEVNGTTMAAGDSVTITNRYTPDPAAVTLPVTKVVDGNDVPDGMEKEFTFLLVPEDQEKDTPMPEGTDDGEAALSIKGEGKAAFNSITYTKAGTYNYLLTEKDDQASGYTYDIEAQKITVVVTDHNGVLSADYSVKRGDENRKEAVFTNTYAPSAALLSLPVEKSIVGNQVPKGEDRAFTFRLHPVSENAPMPENAENNESVATVTGEGSGLFDEISFTKTGTYQYKVTEVKGTDPGYTYDAAEKIITVEVVDEDGWLTASWTLDGKKAESISFTNTYDPEDAVISLPVTKTITGNERSDAYKKDFTFTLQAENPKENAPMPANTPDGEDSVSLTIHDEGNRAFADITFDKVGTYHYTVTESDEGQPGYTYDTAVRDVVVTVTDHDGTLTAKTVITKQGETENTLAFCNTYDPKDAVVSLPVTKTITGNERSDNYKKDFTFTLRAEDPKENAPMPANTPDGENSVSLTIHDEGDRAFADITFDKVGTYHYTVTESDEGQPGYTYDTAVRDVVVTVTDHDGTLTAKTVITKQGETENTLAFCNTYDPKDAVVTLPVIKKKIEGNERPEEKEFRFVLTPEASDTDSGDIPMPKDEKTGNTEDTVVISDEGEASFGEITYTEAGTYTYTLCEENGQENSYGYDLTKQTIVVTVTDTNGVLSAEVTIDGETSQPNSEITFTNQYVPNAAFLSIPIQKVVEGAERPSEAWFTFTLTGEEDAPMPEADGDTIRIYGNGENAFGTISYEKAGEYRYRIAETDDQADGYTYDDQVYDVLVTVIDRNGDLKADWSILAQAEPDQDTDADTGNDTEEDIDTEEDTDAEEDTDTEGKIVFTNVYQPIPADVIIPVKKVVEGPERPTEAAFRFTLTATGDAPMPAQDSVTITGEGTAAFDAITFDTAGEYEYTLAEEKEESSCYTYDETEHRLKVSVTDENGILQTTVTVDDETLPEEGVVFTNIYDPGKANVILTASKKLSGRDLKAKEFSFALKDADGNVVQTVKNDASGNIIFEALSFEETGTFTYQLSEVDTKETGIVYDDSVYTVKVKVIDEGGELQASVEKSVKKLVFTNKYSAVKAAASKLTGGKTGSTSGTSSTKTGSVKTGDDTPITLLVVCFVLAAAVLGCALYIRRRKK